jgi:hypothetical protein
MKYNTKSYGILTKTYQKFRYGFCTRPANYMTSPLRVLPDFFVIGVVRSGTTSLFHYLGQHPCIESSAYDEIGYFDDNFHLGLSWYKSLFPTKFTKNKIKNKHGKFLTYDVTPFYIYNPLVAKRILESFPNAKIISNLRNPIDRAYSNYIIAFQEGDTTKTFEEVIHIAMDELKKNKSKLNDNAYLVNVHYENILARGFYADQLKIWYEFFPKDQLLMVSSEALANNTNNSLNKIFNFLDLSDFKINDTTRKNKREYSPMKKDTRNLLIEFYKPHNEKLYRLIGRNFDWDK